MRRVLITAAAAIAVQPPAAHAADRCHTRACHERVARKQCSQTRPRACVERAIIIYRLHGWQAAWMRRVPGCESGWDPYARNASGSTGLYQFMAGTWATTPYRHRSIWSAKWQALAAAWMVRQHRTAEWVCT